MWGAYIEVSLLYWLPCKQGTTGGMRVVKICPRNAECRLWPDAAYKETPVNLLQGSTGPQRLIDVKSPDAEQGRVVGGVACTASAPLKIANLA